MTLAQAQEILGHLGYGVYRVPPATSSSRRGIHGAPKYRVYSPGSSGPMCMTLRDVRELASSLVD